MSTLNPALLGGVLLLMSCTVRTAPRIHFELEQISLKAPFTVKVHGPDRLLDLGKRKYGKFVGCGYWIEWGDGPHSISPNGTPPDCSKGFAHTYEKPGSYSVTATIFHPGPADETIVDWSESITIAINDK